MITYFNFAVYYKYSFLINDTYNSLHTLFFTMHFFILCALYRMHYCSSILFCYFNLPHDAFYWRMQRDHGRKHNLNLYPWMPCFYFCIY